MKATSSGFGRWTLPARSMRFKLIDQEGALAQRLVQRRLPVGGGKGADALEQALLGVDKGVSELSRNSQQLVAMLVADARPDRHGNDAAEHRGPECIDELLVAREQQYQLVARSCAEFLQVIEDAQGAFVELSGR